MRGLGRGCRRRPRRGRFRRRRLAARSGGLRACRLWARARRPSGEAESPSQVEPPRPSLLRRPAWAGACRLGSAPRPLDLGAVGGGAHGPEGTHPALRSRSRPTPWSRSTASVLVAGRRRSGCSGERRTAAGPGASSAAGASAAACRSRTDHPTLPLRSTRDSSGLGTRVRGFRRSATGSQRRAAHGSGGGRDAHSRSGGAVRRLGWARPRRLCASARSGDGCAARPALQARARAADSGSSCAARASRRATRGPGRDRLRRGLDRPLRCPHSVGADLRARAFATAADAAPARGGRTRRRGRRAGRLALDPPGGAG